MSETNITSVDIPIDYIPSNIVIYRYSDGDFIFIDFNKLAEKTEKINKEELLGKRLTEIFPGVKEFGLFDALLRIYKNGGQEELDICFYEDERINGWRHNCVSKLPNGDLIVAYTDVTKQKELEESFRMYYLAVEQSTSSIYITDKKGLIEYANPHFTKMTGYSSEEIIGKNPRIFKSGKQSDAYYKNLWETIISGQAWHGEIINRYKDGNEVYAMTSISPIKNEEGNISHFVSVTEDITQLKSLQNTLTHQAHYDTLTNIPNRTLFFDRLEKTLAISKRKKHVFALLFIDLDFFKNINDKYGHAIGDQLLIEVSKKIQSCIREADTLARMGGDEFVVLLSEIASIDEPGITAERIIDMCMEPFQISGHTCHIGASIGISLYPKHSSDPDELLALADNAMYRAKSSNGKHYHYAK